ncbi:hypothetical protein [Phenylobacterium sp.]|uniref:hypothetical protein n=1 Tax=Phenylobacterium sp. TaxID=1871053 RepID=UPI0035B4823B
MKLFSPTDAALEGFRLTRERPRVLLAWAIFQFVLSLATAAIMIRLGGQHLMAIESASSSGAADYETMMSEFKDLAPVYAIILPLGLVMMSIMTAAVYRAVLAPSDARLAFLRLGADELRLAALKVVFIFVWAGIAFVVVFLAGAAAALAGVLGGAASRFIGVGIGLFAVGIMLMVAVRLSLAPVITFAERRISVFESWKLTRGMFWPLLGAYVLAVAAIAVIGLLGMVIFSAVTSAIVVAGGGTLADAGAAFNPDATSLASYFTGRTIAYLAFAGVLTALYYAVITAPGAVAYRALMKARDEAA